MPDTRTATWLSHSSIGDFLRCPRGYFLKNVYKNPRSGRKISLMQPPLALGQAVHNVLESLQTLPVDVRMGESLLVKYEAAWAGVAGRRGGFTDEAEEAAYKKRGADMLRRVMDHPGPLLNKTVAMPKAGMLLDGLPSFFLSEDENIILCGKIDWLEYMPEDDSVRILDFKTGKNEEKAGSLQLPIYHLLVRECQRRAVSGASCWYLDSQDAPTEVSLPELEFARRQILDIGQTMKAARARRVFECDRGGCFCCSPYESILSGEAELAFVDEATNREIYVMPADGVVAGTGEDDEPF